MEAAKPEVLCWGGVLGEGPESPFPPAGGLGERSKLPQCRPGQNPGQKDLGMFLIRRSNRLRAIFVKKNTTV